MSIEVLFFAQYLALAQCLGFPFDRIPEPPRFDLRPGRAVRLRGERVRGYYIERRKRAVVALHPDNGTTMLHEAGHHLLRKTRHDHRRMERCIPEAVREPAFGDVNAWRENHG